ncbi:ECT2 protein, partial [Amia calva]|nr:ECT2 protein [Amia calva]
MEAGDLVHSRPAWGSKLQYMLAQVGFSVGLGNVWRFPYLCHQNGGGAFLLLYVLLLALVGVPLFFLELAAGQSIRQGSIGVWAHVSPRLAGIGYASCMVCFFVALYYNVIIGWSLFYLGSSFQYPLPWEECPTLTANTTVRECALSSPTSYFWYRRALDISPSITQSGSFNPMMTGCLLAAWTIVCLAMIKGIKSSGKVMYFSSLFPYVVLLCFLIRGLMLEGAFEGIAYMFYPRLHIWADVQVWRQAATQVFFALGLGFGSIIAYSSYNPPTNNCHRDAVVVATINLMTSLLATLVVFAVLGFRAHSITSHCVSQNVEVLLQLSHSSQLPTQWLPQFNLSDPESVSVGQYSAWFNQLGAALNGTVTPCNTEDEMQKNWTMEQWKKVAWSDESAHLQRSSGVHALTVCSCVLGFLFGLLFVQNSGNYYVSMFDDYSATLPLIIVVIFEAVSVSWLYGTDRFMDDIERMMKWRPPLVYKYLWKFVCPLAMVGLLLASLLRMCFKHPTYKAWDREQVKEVELQYPDWALAILVSLIILASLPIPIGFFRQLLIERWDRGQEVSNGGVGDGDPMTFRQPHDPEAYRKCSTEPSDLSGPDPSLLPLEEEEEEEEGAGGRSMVSDNGFLPFVGSGEGRGEEQYRLLPQEEEEEENSTVQREVPVSYPCPYCEICFTALHYLEKHIKRSHRKQYLDMLRSRARQRLESLTRSLNLQWQMDLVDMSNLSKHNNGHKFMLTCIDMLSKYARYFDKVQDFIEAYNQGYHTSIKMKPIDVDKSNSFKVYKNVYGPFIKKGKSTYKFNISDVVRVSKLRSPFAKGYFSDEYFTVTEQLARDPPAIKIMEVPVVKIKEGEVGSEFGEKLIKSIVNMEIKVPYIRTDNVKEFGEEESAEFETVFVLTDFKNPDYTYLYKHDNRIIGPPVVLHYAMKQEPLPFSSRPLYCTTMVNLVLCFTGFRKKDEVVNLVNLVHHMGGTIRKDFSSKVTHLIAHSTHGEKYRLAVCMGTPILKPDWIYKAWERRNEINFNAGVDEFRTEFKVSPFQDCVLSFLGFSDDEKKSMEEMTEMQGGQYLDVGDERCTHLVVEENTIKELPFIPSKRLYVVKQEWFWGSIQMDARAGESMYFYEKPDSPALKKSVSLLSLNTPNSNRKRRRLKDTLVQLTKETEISPFPPRKRQSAEHSLSMGSLLDISNTPDSGKTLGAAMKIDGKVGFCYFLSDWLTMVAFVLRGSLQFCADLRGCTNGIGGILQICACLRKSALQERDQWLPHREILHGNTLTNKKLMNIIKLHTTAIAIYFVFAGTRTHRCVSERRPAVCMLSVLYVIKLMHLHFNPWGLILCFHFIICFQLFKNPLEKEGQLGGPILAQEEIKTIFGSIPDVFEVHTRIKADLEELVINWSEDKSVGDIILKYSKDLVKAYPPFVNFFEMSKETIVRCEKLKPRFHAFLKINQAKPECGRQTLVELLIRPVQRLPSVALLLNDIKKHTANDNPDKVTLEKAIESLKEVMTHINEDKRKTEGQKQIFDVVYEVDGCPANLLSSHRILVQRVETIALGEKPCDRGEHVTLFLFNDCLEIARKRHKVITTFRSPHGNTRPPASLKHITLMPLSQIRKVLDLKETEDCQNAFALVVHPPTEQDNLLFSFQMTAEEMGKEAWLRTLCRHIANTICKADAEELIQSTDPDTVQVNTKDMDSTLSRASRAIKKTSKKVTRAFSFTKTPKRVIQRAFMVTRTPDGKSPTAGLENYTGGHLVSSSTLAGIHSPSMVSLPSMFEKKYHTFSRSTTHLI